MQKTMSKEEWLQELWKFGKQIGEGAALCCPCPDCEERRKHLHMGGPPTPQSAPKKFVKMSEALERFRPTVATMAQLLMDSPVELSGMVLVRMSENGAKDVYWPIEVITRAVESELRRYGFLLEHKGGIYSARKYR